LPSQRRRRRRRRRRQQLCLTWKRRSKRTLSAQIDFNLCQWNTRLAGAQLDGQLAAPPRPFKNRRPISLFTHTTCASNSIGGRNLAAKVAAAAAAAALTCGRRIPSGAEDDQIMPAECKSFPAGAL